MKTILTLLAALLLAAAGRTACRRRTRTFCENPSRDPIPLTIQFPIGRSVGNVRWTRLPVGWVKSGLAGRHRCACTENNGGSDVYGEGKGPELFGAKFDQLTTFTGNPENKQASAIEWLLK